MRGRRPENSADQVALGLEQEIGVLGLSPDGATREGVVRRLIDESITLPYAWGGGNKHARFAFLANGGALGLDPPASTLEFCTPECADPFELAGSLEAGMRLLTAGARRTREQLAVRVMPVVASVFYQPGESSLGTHESYGVRCVSAKRARELTCALLPWIVSRQLLIEPGVLSRGPGGRGFDLSPRASLMHEVWGTSTTRSRAVFTEGRTAFADTDWRRIHLISAGATLSPWAVILRHGVTALLLKMLLRGHHVPFLIQPADAVSALRSISQDPERPVATTRGPATARQILEMLLLETRNAHRTQSLAPWAGRVLDEWQRGIELCDEDADRADVWLESGLRRRILGLHLRDAGLSWQQAGFWSHFLTMLQLRTVRGGLCRSLAMTLGGMPEALRSELEDLLRAQGFGWCDVLGKRRIIERLQLLDIELSRIDDGITARQTELRAAPVLAEKDVERLLAEPPSDTRARARGILIRRHQGERRLRATWDRVTLPGRLFPLPEPLNSRVPRSRRMTVPREPSVAGLLDSDLLIRSRQVLSGVQRLRRRYQDLGEI